MTLRRVLCFTLAALAGFILPLAGQDARGNLLGRVTDSTDAVIIGAKVEAVNNDTGVHLTTTTNRSGDYIFPLLVPGSYTITVESSGFKTYNRKGIAVRVGDQLSINVAMEVGQANQTVQVTAERPPLDTASASVGRVADSRTLLAIHE